MKKHTLILSLIFTVMLSSPSYAKWTKVDESVSGNTFYVDFEKIRKHDGYVYWWDLSDYLKPITGGFLSAKVYKQGDCRSFQEKILSFSFHKEPMGGGSGDIQKPVKEYQGWKYPTPNSVNETILKIVCAQ